jgi:hypothetical protein
MSMVPRIPEPAIDFETVPDTPDADVAAQPIPTVELRGRRFPITDAPVPLLSMMKLATVAKRQRAGVAVSDDEGLEALSVLYELLRSLIDPAAWDDFEAHANRVGAGADEFEALIGQAVAARAERPTRPSSGSPGGQSTTGTSSAGGSSWPGSSIRQGDERVQADLEARGRPDLALVVQRAREASTTSSTG